MKRNLNIILLFFLSFFSFLSFSQNKQQLKEQKNIVEKEISFTVNLLEKTKANKKNSLKYLKVLDSKINNEDKLLKIMNMEVNLLKKQIVIAQKKINFSVSEIKRIEEDIIKLKDEYASMLYSLQKNRSSKNNLIFIVSSSTFNQAYKRVLYLKQYSQSRIKHFTKINITQDSLAAENANLAIQIIQLEADKKLSVDLINSKKVKIDDFTKTKIEKNLLVSNLSKSETMFKSKIKQQQLRAKELDDKIKEIIKEEIRLAREKAEKINGDNKFSLTPEALILSNEFSSNKGKLPWPLDQGIIVTKYGSQKHNVFKGVETFNNGINIATKKGVVVRSVFKGAISRIFLIKGEGKAVLINHGEYFSVYSGLAEVNVKIGDKIFSKEVIGKMSNDDLLSDAELHFEIWKGYDKQDPSLWLYKAD
tara:strand:- start:2039 stop:3298 length:1260 start_codon:yes stop_codon:yes gene_type:complete